MRWERSAMCGLVLAMLSGPAVAQSHVLVGKFAAGEVARFDPVTGAESPALAVGAGRPLDAEKKFRGDLIVEARVDGFSKLVRVSLETGEVLADLVTQATLQADGVHTATDGLTIDSDGDLYTWTFPGDLGHSSIIQLDGTTGRLVRVFIDLEDAFPDTFAFDRQGDFYAVIAVNSGSELRRYDAETGALIGALETLPANRVAREIRFEPAGDMLVLVTEPGMPSEIRRFDLQTGMFLASLPGLASDAVSFDIEPDGNILLLSGVDASTRVERIDRTTGASLGDVVEPGVINDSFPTFLLVLPGGEPIPAVSTWGAAVMALLLMLVATLRLRNIDKSETCPTTLHW